MKHKIKKYIHNYNVLLRNFSYLTVLQLFNLLVPLITYPYLIRVLGPETYGLIIFVQAIISYLLIIVSFGFMTSATKAISIHRDEQDKLSEIVSSVLIIKGILFFLSLVMLSVTLFIIPAAAGYEALFLLSMWLCLYDVILPTWYFQGLEKMGYIAYLSLISRSLFLCLIFVFIDSSEDYLLLPVINGIGALISGIAALYIIFVKHKVQFKAQSYKTLKLYFIDSMLIFGSIFSVKIYASANRLIIGTFFGLAQVSYYDLAEKLSVLIKTPIQIIGQTLFPRVSKEKNLRFIRKFFYFILVFSILILIVSSVTAGSMITIFGGGEMLLAIPIFKILIISIIPVTFSLFFGNLTLLPFGHNKDYLNIRLASLVFYFALVVVLYAFRLVNPTSLAVSVVLTELVAAIVAYSYCNFRNINFLDKKILSSKI